MKTKLIFAFVICNPLLLTAGGDPVADAKDAFIPEPATSPWRFGVALSPITGADVDFSRLGRWNSPNTLAPLGISTDRIYDDGFNRVDATGNSGNLTSYWSYVNDDQEDDSGTGSIAMSIYNSRANGAVSDDDIGWGAEFFATREVGPAPISFAPDARWGWRLGFHVNRFGFEDSSTLTSGVDITTDTFDLGGAKAPGSPFSGSPAGFGNALLGDQPVRSTSTGTATVTGSRDFDATLIGFSGGPYLDLPLNPQFSLRTQGGLSLAIAHGDYEFSSMTTITGVGTQASGGSSSETTILPGIYAGLEAVYALNPQIMIHGGVRYQYYKSFDIDTAGSEAEIDFSKAFMFTLGVSHQF